MSILKKVWIWLVFSSSNPAKLSLTIRSTLVNIVAIFTVIAGFAQINLPGPEAFTEAINAIVAFVQTVIICIASATTAWGAIRKIWSTVSGENEVVNRHEAFK